MTEQQRPTNSVTQRSILQHLMFGVLFVLILMNWTVHRPLDYEPFNEAFRISDTVINNRSKMLHLVIEEIAKENNSNYENVLKLKASKIISYTNTLVKNLDSITGLLSDSNDRALTTNEKHLANFALLIAKNYYANIIRLLELDSNEIIVSYFPLNKTSLNAHQVLLSSNFFGFEYRTKEMIIADLNSLRNDVINTQQVSVYYIFDRMHSGGCNFGREYRPVYFLNNHFFSQNEKFKIEIVVGNFWGFSKRFSKIDVDKGNIDASELNTEMIAYWRGNAKILGKNTVSGSISKIFRGDTITRPFSFSYFVSAPGIAFHLEKANLCYVGVDNPISIHIPGYPAEKLKLKVAHAKVTKKENGLFEVYFDKLPKGKVYAYVDATNEQGRTSRVHSMELRVKDLPPPITNFDSYKESGMAVDSFFRKESLEVFAADSAFAMDYEVIHFQVEVFTAKHQYFGPLMVYGKEFSGNHELVSILNTISAGDRLIISDIRVRAANGRIYEAAPVSVLLK